MKNWKTKNPKEKGEYLCRMGNTYVKMCYWNGLEWLDMWETTLKGIVKEWTTIPPEKHNVFGVLKYTLKDKEYRDGWIANIAMTQIDSDKSYREEHNKVGKYLNQQDRIAIANKGAEWFIELLTNTKTAK